MLNRSCYVSIVLLCLIISVLASSFDGFAQSQHTNASQENATQTNATHDDDVEEPVEDPMQRRLDALRSLLDKIIEERQQVAALQKSLKRATSEQDKAALRAELEATQAQVAEREDSFMQLITGISVRVYDQTPPPDDTSALDELQAIFEPIFSKIKEVTTRTRRMEQLRTDIAASMDLEQRIRAGLEQTEALKTETDDPMLLNAFEVATQQIQERLEELEQDRAIKEEQLRKLQADRGVWKSFQQFFGELLGRHVMNLFITLLVASGIYAAIRFVYGGVLKLQVVRSRLEDVYWFRIVDVLIRGLIILVAMVGGLFVLYFLNDWILIGLFTLLALGFLWSVKDSLPTQMQHAQLLLNIGSVRERERVIYRGLPWEVRPIGYYTKLVNPALESGHLRVKLAELDGMSSRRFSPLDQWFPTKKNDWVILTDGTYGQVLRQTPEHVILKIFGVSEKTYLTQTFLSLSPLNISKGYALFLTFGVDYAHQDDVTRTIPAILENDIRDGFAEAGQAEHMVSLFVEFNDASASSLDFAVFAQFTAETADRYYKMRRLLLRFLVESCSRNGWTIPFTQVTVHAAEGEGPVRLPQSAETE